MTDIESIYLNRKKAWKIKERKSLDFNIKGNHNLNLDLNQDLFKAISDNNEEINDIQSLRQTLNNTQRQLIIEIQKNRDLENDYKELQQDLKENFENSVKKSHYDLLKKEFEEKSKQNEELSVKLKDTIFEIENLVSVNANLQNQLSYAKECQKCSIVSLLESNFEKKSKKVAILEREIQNLSKINNENASEAEKKEIELKNQIQNLELQFKDKFGSLKNITEYSESLERRLKDSSLKSAEYYYRSELNELNYRKLIQDLEHMGFKIDIPLTQLMRHKIEFHLKN